MSCLIVDSGEVFVRVGGNDTDPALMWLGPVF